MRALVAGGELALLSPERVWQELARGLMEPHPSRMLAVLRDCGALAQLLPEVDALYGVPQPPAASSRDRRRRARRAGARLAAARGVRAAGALCGARARSRQGRDRHPRCGRAHHGHEARSVAARGRGCPSGCKVPARVPRRRAACGALARRRPSRARSCGRPRCSTCSPPSTRCADPSGSTSLLAACAADAMSRPGAPETGYAPGSRRPRRRWRSCARVDVGGDRAARCSAGRRGGDAIAAAMRAARLAALRDWRRKAAARGLIRARAAGAPQRQSGALDAVGDRLHHAGGERASAP